MHFLLLSMINMSITNKPEKTETDKVNQIHRKWEWLFQSLELMVFVFWEFQTTGFIPFKDFKVPRFSMNFFPWPNSTRQGFVFKNCQLNSFWDPIISSSCFFIHEKINCWIYFVQWTSLSMTFYDKILIPTMLQAWKMKF